ncbi:angiopoietin-2 isoform X2 [Folsomia candida]|uniref:angiopoietin-2 isoform X2 n=1 Tax=Folsomia candida TaxID=158441 RepID=UPI000B904126|nr:angiopoietin-2 isoform X2 [Folsomia candida]
MRRFWVQFFVLVGVATALDPRSSQTVNVSKSSRSFSSSSSRSRVLPSPHDLASSASVVRVARTSSSQTTTIPSVSSTTQQQQYAFPYYNHHQHQQAPPFGNNSSARMLNIAPSGPSGPGGPLNIPRNKPLLSSLVNKLETLVSKIEQMNQVQSQIQKSFDNLETRFTLSQQMDDVPQCGRRVDRVLRTLTPLVSRVEGLWSVVSGFSSPPVNSFNVKPGTSSVPPSQFLGDALLSESRRQERAITAIRTDLNVRTQQIMSELGTVEQQLDVLQQKKGPLPPGSGISIDQADQLATDIQTTNDVTFDERFTVPGNSSLRAPPSSGVPAVVFPSVKNKPSAEAGALDGADALLTGAKGSCAELMAQGARRSGLYHIKLPGARSSFWQLLTYCDQDISGGGWMVIQRRADYGEPRESFHRNWVEYRSGFGDPMRELWMGNLNLHLLTSSEDQVLRIELEDFDGEKRYAEYSTFRVASETDGFRLEVGGYSGDAGDALSDPWYGAHGSAFSTHDRDNDRSSLNCASMLKGGWWWKSCGRGLNGLYFDTQQPDSALARQGIVWFRWKGWDYTLKKATMMIRPKSFRPNNSSSTPFTSQSFV